MELGSRISQRASLSASPCEELASPTGEPSGKCSRASLSEAKVGADARLPAVPLCQLLSARTTSSDLKVNLDLLVKC